METSEITLSSNEVTDCLSNLDPSKATGPDGIPASVLKEYSEQIAPSLYALSRENEGTAVPSFSLGPIQLFFTYRALSSKLKVS